MEDSLVSPRREARQYFLIHLLRILIPALSALAPLYSHSAASLHIHPEPLVSRCTRWFRVHDQVLMFFKIGAIIYDNSWGLAAPRQDEGQDQGDAVTVKPAGWLFHDSPILLFGASSE
jgi:hypothetical protein